MQTYRDSIQKPLLEVESDRLSNRVGSGGQDNIAGLNEAVDENSGSLFRFTHHTTPIQHRFGAHAER